MRNVILFLTSLFMFASCEGFFEATKEVDLSEFANQPTVVGRMTSIEAVSLPFLSRGFDVGFFVSRSRSVLDTSKFDLIEDASVKITASDGTDMSFFYHESGQYFPENVGTPEIELLSINENIEYTLEVDIPGEDVLRANSKINTLAKIESINIIQDDIVTDETSKLDRIQIKISDPPGENFYFLEAFHLRAALNPAQVFSYNSSFDGDASIFTDELFDGTTEILEFWIERRIRQVHVDKFGNEVPPNSVELSLWSMSKEEYQFRKSLEVNEEANNNPFVEPSIIFSNIENGLGIFSVSKLETFSIPWEE